jgi:hypothetical protein
MRTGSIRSLSLESIAAAS